MYRVNCIKIIVYDWFSVSLFVKSQGIHNNYFSMDSSCALCRTIKLPESTPFNVNQILKLLNLAHQNTSNSQQANTSPRWPQPLLHVGLMIWPPKSPISCPWYIFFITFSCYLMLLLETLGNCNRYNDISALLQTERQRKICLMQNHHMIVLSVTSCKHLTTFLNFLNSCQWWFLGQRYGKRKTT